MADPYYRLRARVRRRSVEMVEYAAQAMAHAIDQQVPVKSGNLKNSQQVHVSVSGDRASVSIRYPVPYARSNDLGWTGGQILPKNRDFLVFQWPNGPRGDRWYRFAEIENHPGWEGSGFYFDWVTPDIWAAQLERAERDLSSAS